MSFNDVPWRQIDLNLLVAFAYLYRCRSVSQAAEQSCVSQSAMSHSLARLRRLFDDELFERKGHVMEPTEYAHQIAPALEQLLDTLSETLLNKAQFVPQKYDGVCRIGLTDYAELNFAPVIYDRIRAEAPKAQISFVNVNRSNYITLTEKEKLDLVIGSITEPDESFDNLILYTERHVCLVDPAQFATQMPLELAAFAETEHALVSPDGRLTTQVDQLLARAGLTRRVTVASRNFLTIQRLLRQRRLVAIVPLKMAQLACEDAGLKYFTPPLPVPDFDIAMLWLKKRQLDDKSLWLRGLIGNVLTEPTVGDDTGKQAGSG
ncbi:LysR family transcriptional regulator [Pseudoalteromonas rubra]|uniref:LysR family transcriptional regulator n=1 Tax=Pseudoalteromonas rubra TaxID=43658 RepID=A0A5S3WTG0_9GAMM|nr:LysR family transcriptional regulator [Pseudoalteromonas rubra]TMP28063.1 LysR family transcriptional regulator [Pseudoalteromonas rubra]TMP32727.1 LysR family transcriptional regulator [Pseudoalteromonas rubra]